MYRRQHFVASNMLSTMYGLGTPGLQCGRTAHVFVLYHRHNFMQ